MVLDLQKIYDYSLKTWVYEDWFPIYEKCVNEYIDCAKNNTWKNNPNVFERLIKWNSDNGVSDLHQGNFEYVEYNAIQNNWNVIQPIIQKIATNGTINLNDYNSIIEFFMSYTRNSKTAACNKVVASFLPNYVSTTVTQKYLIEVLRYLKSNFDDYPEISDNWLTNNISMIEYFNSKIKFLHPWHSSLFCWYLHEYINGKIIIEKEIKMNELLQLLKSKKNIILQGAPGTGKTYATAELALRLIAPDDKEIKWDDHNSVMNKYDEYKNDGRIKFKTFHQSLDYEDFIEGLKPEPINDDNGNQIGINYIVKSGIFKKICERCGYKKYEEKTFKESYSAFIDFLKRNNNKIDLETEKQKKKFSVSLNKNNNLTLNTGNELRHRGTLTFENLEAFAQGNYEVFEGWFGYAKAVIEKINSVASFSILDEIGNIPCVLIIDEINRGNISKIFGELITLIEKDKRLGAEHPIYVTLPYSEEDFAVPSNLYIIGTMNTTDRSTGSIDYALRRRFAFYTLKSDINVLEKYYNNRDADLKNKAEELFNRVKDFLEKKENRFDEEFDDLMVGHSYFLSENIEGLKIRWEYEILPLLDEYYKDGLIRKFDSREF